MLAKQGWKLLSKLDALVTKVFRAKYFPHENFFNANLRHYQSYIWRSIWSFKLLLNKGVRWRIGDGAQVSVWNDSWLKDTEDMKIQELKVQDLLIARHRE
ncbi:hypothetical protein PTKIN_Ptkin06aG0098200 [Pterospermum kingtungense]